MAMLNNQRVYSNNTTGIPQFLTGHQVGGHPLISPRRAVRNTRALSQCGPFALDLRLEMLVSVGLLYMVYIYIYPLVI